MDMNYHGRYGFSALADRPAYDWPAGKRLAVCLCNNIEWFSFMTGLGSDHTVPGAAQTTRNYAWRDYGLRVGIWRLFEMMERLGIKGSSTLNGEVCIHEKPVVDEMARLGWPILGHGMTNSQNLTNLPEDEERKVIGEQAVEFLHECGFRIIAGLGHDRSPFLVFWLDAPSGGSEASFP